MKCLLPVELDHIQTIQGTPDLSFAVAKYKDIYWNLFQHTSPPPLARGVIHAQEFVNIQEYNIFNFSTISARLPSGTKFRSVWGGES